MKLIKKIGIGCLALIICFCSCFKFVNAYSIQDNNVLYADTTYYLYLSYDIDWDGATIGYVQYNNQTYSLITESYSTIFLSGDYDDFEWPLHYEGNFQLSDYTTYQVYSFTPNITCTFLEYDYSQNQLFIETNLISNGAGVYNSIYTLIERYLFGGVVPPKSFQEMTAILLSGIICVLVFALPFLIIWKVIKVIMG